jgi:hypothetical protein
MRWVLVLSLALIALAAACNSSDPGEGSMECHGVSKGNRCIQFPPNQHVTKLVAAMTALPRYSSLTDVHCHSKGSLAVCDATFDHGSLGVTNAPFKIQADGTVTPICHRLGRKKVTTAFCSN